MLILLNVGYRTKRNMSGKQNNLTEIIFGVLLLLFFTLMLFVENKYGRFQTNDFRVMYEAANAFVHGNVVYGEPFGLDTGYYKYSPFTLLLFVPYTLVSFKVAAIIHFFIIALCAVAAIILIERIVTKLFFPDNNRKWLTYILLFLSLALHLVKDLHLGNTNTILIFLLIATLYFCLEGKMKIAALFITIAILTKPYFAIVMLTFLLNKKYRFIIYSMVYGLLFLLITIVAAGFSSSLQLHLQWIESIINHSVMLESSYTVFYLLNYYLGISITASYSYHLFILMGGLSYLYFWFQKRKDEKNNSYNVNQSLFMYFAFLIAIIPNILITDNEHFLFSLPIIAFLIRYLQESKNYWLIGLFIIAIFMYGGNSTDLVGNDLTLKIKLWGFLGIGNLMIISMAMIVYHLKKSQWVLVDDNIG